MISRSPGNGIRRRRGQSAARETTEENGEERNREESEERRKGADEDEDEDDAARTSISPAPATTGDEIREKRARTSGVDTLESDIHREEADIRTWNTPIHTYVCMKDMYVSGVRDERYSPGYYMSLSATFRRKSNGKVTAPVIRVLFYYYFIL